MQLNTYLLFDGNCEEAFNFYAQTLNGKIESMMPHKGSPAESHTPPEWQDKILHARMTVGNQVIMASDAPPGRQAKPQGFSVNIGVTDPAEADRIYGALSEGAKITMPIGQTFWARRFAMFEDRFGIPWMINCE